MNGERFRPPTAREKRAERWLSSQFEDYEKNKPDLPEINPRRFDSSFIVKRELIATPEVHEFINSKLTDSMPRGKFKAVERKGLIIVNGVDLKILFGGDYDHNEQRDILESTTSAFPERITGFARGGLILGVGPNRPGRRYIGFGFDRDLRARVLEERAEVYGELGKKVIRNMIPNLTLFTTRDQWVAQHAQQLINENVSKPISVEFGPPEVIPVQSNPATVLA